VQGRCAGFRHITAALECLVSQSWKDADPDRSREILWLHTNPYWTRAWIAQEIIHSKKVSVCTDRANIDWQLMNRATHAHPRFQDSTLKRIQPLNPAFHYGMRNDRQSEMTSDRLVIWDLLHRMRDAQCSDRRDRIYSLLSLVKCGEDFPASYTESTIDIFWRAGEHFTAWCRPHCIAMLQQALELDSAELDASVIEHPDMPLHIPGILTTLQHEPLSPDGKYAKVECSAFDCKQEDLGFVLSRRSNLFCSKTARRAGPSRFKGFHVLVTAGEDTVHSQLKLTLAVRDWSLGPSGIRTMELGANALQHYTKFGWQEVQNWSYFEELRQRYLHPRRGERRRLHDGWPLNRSTWRLRVSATVALELSRCAGDPTVINQ
jgi:hypothetical protein